MASIASAALMIVPSSVNPKPKHVWQFSMCEITHVSQILKSIRPSLIQGAGACGRRLALVHQTRDFLPCQRRAPDDPKKPIGVVDFLVRLQDKAQTVVTRDGFSVVYKPKRDVIGDAIRKRFAGDLVVGDIVILTEDTKRRGVHVTAVQLQSSPTGCKCP